MNIVKREKQAKKEKKSKLERANAYTEEFRANYQAIQQQKLKEQLEEERKKKD